MPVYAYLCLDCGAEHEAERSVRDRATARCPTCSAPPERQEIQLGSLRVVMKNPHAGKLRTEAEVIAERGADWRENKASRRIKAGEPERLYFGKAKVDRKR